MIVAAIATVATALALRIDGVVTVSPPVRTLKQQEQVHSGETITVPKGSEVVLLCSTDRWIRVTGAREWVFDSRTCSGGTTVTPGSYRELAAENGRLRAVKRGLAIEIETRADDENPLVPLLLAPRNTAVVNPRPAISWRSVPRATDYVIEWLGRDASTTRLPADQVRCDGNVCTVAYADDRPPLAPGTTYFVTVRCRTGIAAPWRAERNAAEVRTLDERGMQRLRTQLDEAAKLPAAADVRNLLVAGAFADAGVLDEARERYRRSMTPAAWVTAGDLALTMGLPTEAIHDYERASSDQCPASVRAAAAFGLGRVAMARRRYQEARDYFRCSHDWFSSLGLADAASEASAELAEMMRILERRSK